MNPDTNKFEPLTETVEKLNRYQRRAQDALLRKSKLVRPDGSPVPDHWPIFTVGERIVCKGYTFEVSHIGESHLLLEPKGPLLIGDKATP